MTGNYFAPHSFVVSAFLFVLGLVNEGNTLSVVEDSCFAIIAVLDLENCVLLGLGGLSTSEIHKCCFLVQSKRLFFETYLTGWCLWAPLTLLSATSFPIFMLCYNDNLTLYFETLSFSIKLF